VNTPRVLAHDVATTASWYGKQVRCVTSEVTRPIRRAIRLVVDDESAIIELAATGEDMRIGIAAPPRGPRRAPASARQ
jgi:hypothetical protein